MPEGHSIKILANRWNELKHVKMHFSSPQGRFAEQAEKLDGEEFQGASVHGKHLFLHFPQQYIHIHLGLYGRFRWHSDPHAEPVGQVRMRTQWNAGSCDLIGPTRCELLDEAGVQRIHDRLGPDPLRPNDTLAPMMNWLTKSSWPMGRTLLDQAKMAGIGNVYRAEMLFMLGMSPWRETHTLTTTEWDEVWRLARSLLTAGVRDQRIITTSKTLPPPVTLPPGTACASRTYVYKRTGEPCVACGTLIESTELASRTLYWCPQCQPEFENS